MKCNLNGILPQRKSPHKNDSTRFYAYNYFITNIIKNHDAYMTSFFVYSFIKHGELFLICPQWYDAPLVWKLHCSVFYGKALNMAIKFTGDLQTPVDWG